MAPGIGLMRADLASQIESSVDDANSFTASFTQMAELKRCEVTSPPVDKMTTNSPPAGRVCSGLNKIKGFFLRIPKGAFYAFPNIRRQDVFQETRGRFARTGRRCCFGGTASVRMAKAISAFAWSTRSRI